MYTNQILTPLPLSSNCKDCIPKIGLVRYPFGKWTGIIKDPHSNSTIKVPTSRPFYIFNPARP